MRPQYINLYQKDTRWQSRLFTANGAAIALGVLAAGLAAVTIISTLTMRSGEVSAGIVTAHAKDRNAALQAANASYQSRQEFQGLQARVQRLQQVIGRQDIVLERLRDTEIDPTAAFSARLRAIGLAQMDGVWLTRMNIQNAPARLNLTGVAMDAGLLPRYLAQLGGKARLGVRQLDKLTLDRSVNDPRAAAAGAVGFTLELLSADARGAS